MEIEDLNSRNFWNSAHEEIKIGLEIDSCFSVSSITLFCIFKINYIFYVQWSLGGNRENVFSNLICFWDLAYFCFMCMNFVGMYFCAPHACNVCRGQSTMLDPLDCSYRCYKCSCGCWESNLGSWKTSQCSYCQPFFSSSRAYIFNWTAGYSKLLVVCLWYLSIWTMRCGCSTTTCALCHSICISCFPVVTWPLLLDRLQ